MISPRQNERISYPTSVNEQIQQRRTKVFVRINNSVMNDKAIKNFETNSANIKVQQICEKFGLTRAFSFNILRLFCHSEIQAE